MNKIFLTLCLLSGLMMVGCDIPQGTMPTIDTPDVSNPNMDMGMMIRLCREQPDLCEQIAKRNYVHLNEVEEAWMTDRRRIEYSINHTKCVDTSYFGKGRTATFCS